MFAISYHQFSSPAPFWTTNVLGLTSSFPKSACRPGGMLCFARNDNITTPPPNPRPMRGVTSTESTLSQKTQNCCHGFPSAVAKISISLSSYDIGCISNTDYICDSFLIFPSPLIIKLLTAHHHDSSSDLGSNRDAGQLLPFGLAISSHGEPPIFHGTGSCFGEVRFVVFGEWIGAAGRFQTMPGTITMTQIVQQQKQIDIVRVPYTLANLPPQWDGYENKLTKTYQNLLLNDRG